MTTKNTNLKFSEVKKKAKQSKQTEQYTLSTGETITFSPTFAYTEIEKMFENIQKSLATIPEGTEDSPKAFQNFILFHVIKHFTHFKKDLKANTYAGQIDELEAIIDTEVEGKSLFQLLVNDIFLQSEIQKVFDAIAQLLASSKYVETLDEKVKEYFNKIELQNKDVLFKFKGEK